ncbi:MAG TPA: cobalamin biosynthesis protein CbiA [Acidobacteriota bacterium]|nr:cobalamin biosynthesis protein CbiA [Acidobacteriota bacterium]
MTRETIRFQSPAFDRGIIAIVGGFGSGKSEVSVNLARYLAQSQSLAVTIADLDIINPYFRSREAADELAALGIRSLIPPGDQAYADTPIIIPEIKGAIKANTGMLILDVGGEDLGARVLSSLREAFVPGRYDLLMVLNRNRPFTATLQGTLKLMRDIEEACGLKFTGCISNTHLLEETTVETVMDGLQLTREVGEQAGLPVRLLTVTADIAGRLDAGAIDVPVLALDRTLLKPWERRKPAGPDA